MTIDEMAAATGAEIVQRVDLEYARRWYRPVAVIRVTSAAMQRAVKMWAHEHKLDPDTPKVDSRERERRKAVTARAIRKKRPLPIFATEIRLFAWSQDAWL